MAGDEQDIAEDFDEENLGLDPVSDDESPADFPPERPRGLRFADSDVTDESLLDRVAQEQPEIWDAPPEPGYDGDSEPLVGLDLDDVKAGEQVIVGDPADESAEEAALHVEDTDR